MATQLPIRVEEKGRKSEGFCTPKEDKSPQQMKVLSNKVIPIVFLPGIMGSNLRLSQPRQWRLKKANNIAWRPDRHGEALDLLSVTPAYRQLALDPDATEVDTYDDGAGTTGTFAETSAVRHKVSSVNVTLPFDSQSPLLTDDPATSNPRKTKKDKARERGWQEVLLSSYQVLLEKCEYMLNASNIDSDWSQIADRAPAEWQSATSPELRALSTDEIRVALSSAWFPVHAMGYNWLKSNAKSAKGIALRIGQLIEQYQSRGYQCEKVVVITHSMGGLVARALVHPEIGDAMNKVLGIVHGVMPSQGAPAAYRRMRCGFEEGLLGWAPAPKVLGNFGPEVTAVLGNSEGGLQLLPSKAYGNHWLEVRQDRNVLLRLPTSGDPYEEIYKLKTEWYRLIREDWLNPAKLRDCTVERTFLYLDNARRFHELIANEFHPVTYAHYGAGTDRSSWAVITWNVSAGQLIRGWERSRVVEDNRQGRLSIVPPGTNTAINVTLGPSVGAGDQTVPLRSADHQRQSGKLCGVFMQSGYEHQESYQKEVALRSTLYSLVRIIQTMKWSRDGKA